MTSPSPQKNPFAEILGEDRPLRIYNVPWHVPHQYEMYKLPFTEWAHQSTNIRRWAMGSKEHRPKPANVHDVAAFEAGKYDLAVLHVDQQCVDPGIGKSRLYRELNEAVQGIPKIVINHGTPFWPELYPPEYMIVKMKHLIGDNHMVVNSHRAAEMWGPMGKSTSVIIHGLDPKEWHDLPKEPRVVTTLSPAGLDEYYNRRLLTAVKDKLKSRGIQHVHISVDRISKGFDDYRDFVGRSLIYFNPTLESPMPRSRTEAMLSGCCTITLPNHGAEKFIQHGVNGFHVPNEPNAIVELITALMANYKECIRIGQEGKKTATELFNMERYQAQWTELVKKVLTTK